MTKLTVILCLIFFTFSCGKNEDNIKKDITNKNQNIEKNSEEKDERKIDKNLEVRSGGIEYMKFGDDNIDKIDSFYVKMQNSGVFLGNESGLDTSEQVREREFKNLKIEVRGQLPYILNFVNSLLENKSDDFLKTNDGLKFERLVSILTVFDFINDFSGVNHYDINIEKERFDALKTKYNQFKNSNLKEG